MERGETKIGWLWIGGWGGGMVQILDFFVMNDFVFLTCLLSENRNKQTSNRKINSANVNFLHFFSKQMVLIAPRDCYVAVTGYDISITESTKWEKNQQSRNGKRIRKLETF